MNTEPTRISTMRLYGGSIAIVSGVYSGYLATTGVGMTTAAWGMLALGLLVLVHGIVLVSPAASALGTASGPLMIGYAVLMLLNQAWMASGAGMETGMSEMNDGMMASPMHRDGSRCWHGRDRGADAAEWAHHDRSPRDDGPVISRASRSPMDRSARHLLDGVR